MCHEIAAMNSPSLLRWIPALTWLRGDVLAGITLAAYLLPAALGDASLANGVTAQVHGQR
jgi:sulfate permease, SulP family